MLARASKEVYTPFGTINISFTARTHSKIIKNRQNYQKFRENSSKNMIFGKLENPDSWEFPPSNMDPSLLSALGWDYGII